MTSAINWDRLRTDIVDASVTAVNATLYLGLERAERDVPVRKVFAGGRQTVRFKTAEEIDKDRDLRARLGLAPERLATPAAIAAARRQGLNPIRSTRRFGDEEGFARTIERPSSDPRRDRSGRTRAERGLTENRPNRANRLAPGGDDRRLLNRENLTELDDEFSERRLTARGRYELARGRAIAQKMEARVDLNTGLIRLVQTSRPRLGGGLRSTLRVEKASAETYPVIKGSLVAGDKEHDYAIHQELGNRHNPAHPFLRPRLPEWREELPRQLERSLGRLGR